MAFVSFEIVALAKRWSKLGSIVSVSTAEKAMALTFDDGPSPTFTPELLDTLAKHGARATFFLTGENASACPHLLERMAGEGHEIANHTWSHQSLCGVSKIEFDNQITRAQLSISPYGGRLFRPPYGYQNLTSFVRTRRYGYQVVCWSVDSFDWMQNDVQSITENILRASSPGQIVLMHDNLVVEPSSPLRDRSSTIKAVQRVMATLDTYRFVTVSELLQLGAPVMKIWLRPSPFTSLLPAFVMAAARKLWPTRARDRRTTEF